jgi:hypothetical protein
MLGQGVTRPRALFAQIVWLRTQCRGNTGIMSDRSPENPGKPAAANAPDPRAAEQPEKPAKPSLLDLFIAFATISLSGFGGILAWSHRMLVEQRKWMTQEEFNDAYALCQFLPGPDVINLSEVFGRQIAGVPGAIAALGGLVGPGFLPIGAASLPTRFFVALGRQDGRRDQNQVVLGIQRLRC